MIEIYFDGSCIDNPHGAMGYGYHINLNGSEIHSGFSGDVKSRGNSNNVAEYRGLLLALNECLDLSGKTILIRGDSQLVIKQMNGKWKIKGGMYKEDAITAYKLVTDLKMKNLIKFEWIPREHNTRADELSNMYYKTV